MGALTLGSAAPVDPLAGLPVPSNSGGCVAGFATTLNPGCYTSIADTVETLNPGIYYVTGPVDIGHLTGTEVLIYLVGGGNLSAVNNRSLTLTAATSGTYKGIAIFQDPSNTNGFSFGQNFSLSVSGAIYAPAADLHFANAMAIADTGCTFFLARSIIFSNTAGTLSHNDCAALYGDAFSATTVIEAPSLHSPQDQRHFILHAEHDLVDRHAGFIAAEPARDAVGSSAHAFEIESTSGIRHGPKLRQSGLRVHRLKEDGGVGHGRAVDVKHSPADLALWRPRLRSASFRAGRWLDSDLFRELPRILSGALNRMLAIAEHIESHLI
jgi:hypothetical protein